MSLFRRNLIANASGSGNWDFIGTFIVANDDTSWLFNKNSGGDYYELYLKGLWVALSAETTYSIQIKDKRNNKIIYEFNGLSYEGGFKIGMLAKMKQGSNAGGGVVDLPSYAEEFIDKCSLWYPIEDFDKVTPLYFQVSIKSNMPFTIFRGSLTYVSGKNSSSFYTNQVYNIERQSNKVTVNSTAMYQ